MKRIRKSLGITCFCISLIFGVYELTFGDYPQTTESADATVLYQNC
ncbi:MAG: hypothetical protein J7L22_06980 [Candidatus Marinimicrobia bacterium]|nr:hypothetical protein [Candidatus Neomarinimicrobiota bacterium]